MTLTSVACGESGDPAYLVKDLRVLAVQANPPEVLYDAPSDASLSFTALVVDPQGASIDYRWSLCPVESNEACLDYEARKDNAPAAFHAALDDMHAIAASGSALPIPESQGLPPIETATRAVWSYDVATFNVTAPRALYDYHLQSSFFGAGLGAWPSAVLELTSASQTLRVGKRVVINAAHSDVYADALGITVCPDPDVPDEPPGCVPLRPRVANNNPTFAEVQIAYGKSALGTFEPLVGTAEVSAGASIRLLPVLGPDAYESYQVLKVDLESLAIFVEDRVEAPSVSWFCSDGEIQEQLTWVKFTRGLDTIFTAPKTPPTDSDGLVTVWLVARDERGGVGWQNIEIHVSPE
ncbi:MAG: hypothetical protein AAB426_03075 [Myxococcota bacterium]